MSLKDAFKPSGWKILALIIIFALMATYGFVPSLIGEICVSDCFIEIGFPFKFFFYKWGSGTETVTNFNTYVFIIDIIVFYLALCLISLILNLGRRKDVPNSDSGRRDSSPPEQTGPGYQEIR
jgi:hypothetical protein